MLPLFQDMEFLLRSRPSLLGKNGPNSVKAPPPIEEQLGPEHGILILKLESLNITGNVMEF